MIHNIKYFVLFEFNKVSYGYQGFTLIWDKVWSWCLVFLGTIHLLKINSYKLILFNTILKI